MSTAHSRKQQDTGESSIPSNAGVVHDWLVGLVLEVAVPATGGREVGSRPSAHLSQLFLRRPDLHTGLNAVRRQRAGALEVPLLEDPLLDFGVATGEVVERLDIRLRPVHREGEVVVLEVAANTRQVDQRLDAGAAQLLGVSDTRALQDKRRAEGAAADDDLFAGPVDLAGRVLASKRLAWDGGDTNRAAVLDDDLVDLGVALEVQVVVLGPGAVDVCVRGIASAACRHI